MFAIIAVYLFATGIWQLRTGGVDSRALINLLLGCCSIVVMKYVKRIYISPEGIVKETHTWITHHREILPWSDIKHLTLMSKGDRLIAFVEKDTLGQKIFFERKDIPLIKEIFRTYGPKIPVKVNESGSMLR